MMAGSRNSSNYSMHWIVMCWWWVVMLKWVEKCWSVVMLKWVETYW